RRVEVRLPRLDRERRALHEDRRLAVAGREIGAAHDGGGGAIRGGAAIEEPEGARGGRGLPPPLRGGLAPGGGLVLSWAVGVVLDGDGGERLPAEPERVHVAVGGEGEETRRGVAAREQRMAETGDAASATVLQLLCADDQDDVVGPGGHRQARVAERVGAC